jgi:Tfp pilus assembly protein PilF
VWYQVGYRLKNEPSFFDRSRELIEKLMARPGASGTVFLARGILYEREKDPAGAEAVYRKALSLQPDLFVAMNNLAMCLVRRKGDMKEAADLASKAIQLRPNVAALYDTLAVVQAQAGDYKSAAANMREAIRLEPDALKWRVNLLGILVDGQDRNEAMRTLREIDKIMGSLDAGDAETIEKLDSIRAKLGIRPATRPATAPATIAK